MRQPLTQYYSQHGEDFLLDRIFEDQRSGFFVEVGCIDGKRFSNTLSFEQRGWKGLCVEGHADYIESLKRNRPNSFVVHCAAGEKDEDEVVFYANSRGSLSTLDRSQEQNWRNNFSQYFTGFVEQKVRKRRLDSIFKELAITEIDFISIDVEGYEPNVLRGIDFTQYRPRVLVVESELDQEEQEIDSILLAHEYLKAGRLHQNLFYCADEKLMEAIADKHFQNVKITHTVHPLDPGDDLSQTVEIDLRTKNQKIEASCSTVENSREPSGGIMRRGKSLLKKILFSAGRFSGKKRE